MRYISILRVLCFAILCGPATAQMRATFQFDAAFGSRGNGPGQFSDPGALALDIAGDVYVADTGNDRIQKLQPDGTFLREAGGFGWGDGQFRKPSGIAVGKGLEVYVADSRNHRIQIFSFQLLLTGIIGGQDIEASPEFGELSRVTVTNAN
ncbi:MAG: NHL repeat-containing protein, partial [bacterium]|nr:NHL repeat-containing protein [bacterium]